MNDSSDEASPKGLPPFAVRAAQAIFVAGLVVSFLLIIHSIIQLSSREKTESNSLYYIAATCALGAAAAFTFILRKVSDHLKVNLALLAATILALVYGFEVFLEFSRPTESLRPIIAKEMGVPFDDRTKMEVIDDFNRSGIDAYPNFHPGHHLRSPVTRNGLESGKGKVFPLGGIANKVMVQANETGTWMTYKGDRYGFHNPDAVYEEEQVDVLLVGDSLAEGWCVQSDQNIRAVLTELGYTVVNVGKSGNGPLAELASLKEYGAPLNPTIVLWTYCYNDVYDLRKEMQSSLLMRYLQEEGFSQNLRNRQEEIDKTLIGYFHDKWAKEGRTEKELVSHNRFSRIVKLYNLRTRMNLIPTPRPNPVFKEILSESNQLVEKWGGKMYFIPLPLFRRFATGREDASREFVLRYASELRIPVIDMNQDVFDHHPDPMSLFPFRTEGHYNAEGYRLVAEAIAKRLESDGVAPSKFVE